MFLYIRKNKYIQVLKPLLKPIYLVLARLFIFVFELFVFIIVKILKFTFGIELINSIIFIAPRAFIKTILKSCGCKIGKNAGVLPHITITNAAGNYTNLIIKDGCFIGKGVNFDLVEPIELGENSVISGQVTILTHQDAGPNNELRRKFPRKTGKVVIGKNAWVGVSSTILCGITIGECSLVGASSLVIEDIPSHSVAVGVPTKVIKKIDMSK